MKTSEQTKQKKSPNEKNINVMYDRDKTYKR